MKRNVWLIMGGVILIVTLVIVLVRRCLFIPAFQPPVVNPSSSTLVLSESSFVTPESPLISDLRVHNNMPLNPGEETGISIDVSYNVRLNMTYAWYVDAGRIVRGKESSAIIYRAPDEAGVYGVRVVVKWDGQTLEKITFVKVQEELTSELLTSDTSILLTNTPLPSTLSIPTATPTLLPSSPDTVRKKLISFNQPMQALDKLIKQTTPERLEIKECQFIAEIPAECWGYRFDTGNVLQVRGSELEMDLYAYDLDSNGQFEIFKWDLERNGQFEVIEYDFDGDNMFDFALADMNCDQQFGDDEIYMYQDTKARYVPLFPIALSFPSLPIFLY